MFLMLGHLGRIGRPKSVTCLRESVFAVQAFFFFSIMVVLSGVCCRWDIVCFCTWWCCMGIKVLIVKLRSLL